MKYVRLLTGGGLAVVALLACCASLAAADDTVPILTGGLVHWTGSVTRTYHGESDDPTTVAKDDASGTIHIDTRFVLPANYPNVPAASLPGDSGFATVRGQAGPQIIGGSSETISTVCLPGDPDCPYNLEHSAHVNEHCAWSEQRSDPYALSLVNEPRTWMLAPIGDEPRSAAGGTATDSSCTIETSPTLWECRNVDNPDDGAGCGTDFTFPATPREGDTAAYRVELDHAAHDFPCNRSDEDISDCSQSGHSTLEISCALCVTQIQFRQPDLPSASLSEVPATGTFDGNRVRVTATIHNASDQTITAPVRFWDRTTSRDLPVAKTGIQPQGQVTFPAGADTTVDLDWNSDGFAWYPPHTPAPHQIEVLTPYGGARRDLRVRPKPVMLVHGFNATPSTWAGYPDQFKGIRDDWLARTANGMSTDPTTGNTIFDNGRILGTDVQQMRDELDAEHVDLVAHSMGGLISRSYLNYQAPDDADGRPVVAHLVMLGTPNMGSPCANAITALTIGIGMAQGKSQSGAGNPTFQLTPAYVADIFDHAVSNTRGTKFSVLAGNAPLGVELGMAAMCGMVVPNDMVVEQRSAFWTLTDTATQAPLMHTAMTHDPTALQGFVVPHLVDTPEGPIGARGAHATGEAARSARSATATRTLRRLTAKPPTPAALAVTTRVTVRPHKTRRMRIKAGSSTGVTTLILGGAGVRAALQDPSGKHVDDAATTAGTTFLTGTAARHGSWTLVLDNTSGATERVSVGAAIRGDHFTVVPKLRVVAKRTDGTAKRIAVSVAVHGAGGTVRAAAITRAVDGSGKAHKLALHRRGTGFTANIKPLPVGIAVVVIVRGRRGTRTATASIGAGQPTTTSTADAKRP